MNGFPNPPRYRTRPTHPRFIVGHSLEQIQKLSRIQGNRELVEYGSYAREHGLSLILGEFTQTAEQFRAALEKDAAFFKERYDITLYHVITPEDYRNDRIRLEQGVPARPSLRMPWGERSNFLVPQLWFIDKDTGIATNLRAMTQRCDEWDGKIDLNDYLFDVELLRVNEPTALTGQVYDRESVELILTADDFQTRVREGLVMGTLGGPFANNRNDRPVDFTNINLNNVAFRVLEAELKDDTVIGSVKFIGPMAEAARALTYGEDFVFGLRGVVTKTFVDGVAHNKVQGIVTWDMVTPR